MVIYIDVLNFLIDDFDQVFAELEVAKKENEKLNHITMNAVMAACVSCGDIDRALRVFDEMSKPGGCGVDNVTYGTLLKVGQKEVK